MTQIKRPPRLDTEEFIITIHELGYEVFALGSIPEGKVVEYRKSQDSEISIKLVNNKYWYLQWIGGIGVIVKTLDLIGYAEWFILEQEKIIEEVITKIKSDENTRS